MTPLLLMALSLIAIGALIVVAAVIAPAAWLDDRTERSRDE